MGKFFGKSIIRFKGNFVRWIGVCLVEEKRFWSKCVGGWGRRYWRDEGAFSLVGVSGV